MGTAGSVCAQPPAAQGLLDQFLAGVRFFGEPDFCTCQITLTLEA